jgi:hypothetical protein
VIDASHELQLIIDGIMWLKTKLLPPSRNKFTSNLVLSQSYLNLTNFMELITN